MKNHMDHEAQPETAPEACQHGPSSGTPTPQHWLSLEHWEQSAEFNKIVQTEFESSPLREESASEESWARRDFLKLMGASIALTSAAGCVRRPQEKIVPYAKQPEEVTHGVANFYTSSYSDGLDSVGLLVRSNEGRPTKIEGNPLHPLTQGGTSARAQAHILSLYDPDRLRGPKRNLLNKERTNRDTIAMKYDDLDKAVVEQLKKGGVAILTPTLASPSLRAVVSDFCQAFKAEHYAWEPISYEAIQAGHKSSFGDAVLPQYHFDKAKLIVSVDADFLGTWVSPTLFNKQFAAGRRDPKTMSQLVVFESNYSLTGGNADFRARIKPSQQGQVLLGLAHSIVVKKGHGKYAGQAGVKSALDPYSDFAKSLGVSDKSWSELVDSLIANAGRSLIVAGGMPGANAEAVQVAANFLNSALGNDGVTVDYKSGMKARFASETGLSELIAALNAGKIKTVIIWQANPVYSAPKSGIVEALKKAEMVVSTSETMDETSLLAHYIAPDNHPLEGWGDSESYGGVVAIQQPTIRGLYDTRSLHLTLMTWGFLAKQGPKRLQEYETSYDYIRSVWREEIMPSTGKGKNFDDFWEEVLQNGFVQTTVAEKSTGDRGFKTESLTAAAKDLSATASKGMELVLYPTVMFREGTLSNVSWLNELPDPVTKIVWDNYASVSLATAKRLNLEEGDMVKVKVGEQEIEIAAHIQPGMHDEVVAIAIGYGRTNAGRVGNGVGVNASILVTQDKQKSIYVGSAVEIKKTGETYKLASTQHHHAMDGRKIVNEVSHADYMKDEAAGNKRPHTFSIWSGHQYNGHKWGMAVDLNTCTGCSACMVACQSENNVSVVGKKYVLQGREMHWIRIDRYYVGDPETAHAVFQPVMCQHCDNAPCETVCPVAATVHSSEGTNDMIYNRCVGTRYCSNNCPYKVRRFNWFNFIKNVEKPLHLAYNPDVTVRVRGVMEKCTFCTHRIKAVRIQARVDGREMKDGDVKVACEQACPTNAIVFGDLNDPESRVAKVFKSEPRAYGLIEEFNAAPSVRYLTKIRKGPAMHKEEASS